MFKDKKNTHTFMHFNGTYDMLIKMMQTMLVRTFYKCTKVELGLNNFYWNFFYYKPYNVCTFLSKACRFGSPHFNNSGGL